MSWKSIRLELARTQQYPQGSPRHVYILHAPLTAEGLIDEQRLEGAPAKATVHRYWEGERPRSGYVIKTPRGWALSYERGEDDDELLFHLEGHPLRPGDYVTITDADGEALPMRVTGAAELSDASDLPDGPGTLQ